MKVTKLVAGMFYTNTYLLEENDSIILIDPASKADKLFPLLEGKKLLAVLLTHGHLDHIKACDELNKTLGCPIYVNKEDEVLIRDKTQGANFGIENSPSVSVAVNYLKEGKMNIGPFNFEVIFTPGHSKGSTCFVFENDLFTGDTLFKGSVGRTDLYGGDERKLKDSLRLLKELKPDLIVHPGHDEETVLEDEIAYNPFMR